MENSNLILLAVEFSKTGSTALVSVFVFPVY